MVQCVGGRWKLGGVFGYLGGLGGILSLMGGYRVQCVPGRWQLGVFLAIWARFVYCRCKITILELEKTLSIVGGSLFH